jgi:hypothetical protein
MKLMNNEKGSSLITVLLVALIFMTIGLAIISASINGALRTEIRETDIDVTYQATNIMEEIVADLKLAMKKKDPRNPGEDLPEKYHLSLLKYGGTVDPSFDDTLTKLREDIIIPKYDSLVESLVITDISDKEPYNIDKSSHFTRVWEIIVTVKDPHKETLKRTMKRNVILSPTPSFLQYAVGSLREGEDMGLEINGSPNILGNVFANDLKISQNAKFCPTSKDCTTNEDWLEIPTPYPSIFGDIYSEGKDFRASISKTQFYKEKMPSFKNHSQFVDVNFIETFNQRADELLQKITRPNISYSNGNFQNEFKSYVNDRIDDGGTLIDFPRDEKETSIELSTLTDQAEIALQSINNETINLTNTANSTFSGPVKVRGNVNLSNISTLQLPELIVDGDLTITNYGVLQIGNLFVTGDVTIDNFSGYNVIGMPENQTQTVIGEKLNIVNEADFQINGNVFVNGNTKLETRDSSFTIRGYVMGNGDFYVLGNDDLNKNEDDNFIFDSVIYVRGQSFISSANIFGADNNDKQLVLLSNGDLTITRINEFKNFSSTSEPENFYGEVKDPEIKPLQAFFYTHSNAELYGVGSLFYIDGGIFAREHLEINAIRGEIPDHSENSLIEMANGSTNPSLQTDKLSRFNVKYDKKVLLRRIDDLPLVDELQVIPDAIELQ